MRNSTQKKIGKQNLTEKTVEKLSKPTRNVDFCHYIKFAA